MWAGAASSQDLNIKETTSDIKSEIPAKAQKDEKSKADARSFPSTGVITEVAYIAEQ